MKFSYIINEETSFEGKMWVKISITIERPPAGRREGYRRTPNRTHSRKKHLLATVNAG